MKRSSLLAFAFASSLVAAGLFVPATAFAKVPSIGETVVLSPAPICDTLDQIKDLVAASVAKPDGGIVEKYTELNGTKNAKGEPVCNVQAAVGATILEVIDLGQAFTATAIPAHAWAVHFSAGSADAWVLYGELTH